MDSTAIELIQQTAIQAARENRLDTPVPAVILGENIHSIEHLQLVRSRFRGKMTTHSFDDFVQYTKDYPYGKGFIDTDNMSAKIFFNLGAVDQPGHADWTATLQLKKTAEYAAMCQILGNRLSQRDMIDFAEDWAGNLTAVDADGGFIDAKKAITAIRKLTIKESKESTHAEKDFGARRSGYEEIEASSESGLPYGFGFTAIPYDGFITRSFTLRLSILTGGDKPQLVLRAIAFDSAKEAIAQEFKSKLIASIGDAATLYLGSFSP